MSIPIDQMISPERIDQMIRRTTRRQLVRQVLLAWFALLAVAGLVFSLVVWSQESMTALDAAPALAVQIVSILLLVRLWRTNPRQRARFQALASPTASAVRAALAGTREEIRQHRRLGAVLALVNAPLFGLSLVLLHHAGKTRAMDTLWLGLMIGIALAVALTVIFHRVRHQLEPRLRVLEGLQAQLDE